jgi:sugar lactone lactonase YvrE
MKALPIALLALTVAGCQANAGRMAPQMLSPATAQLVEVASFDHQWTGVTVSHAGRIFVNFPRWNDFPGMSVAELKKSRDGRLAPAPFPNADWQQWKEGDDPKSHFVCVQSVVVDDQDFLWVVDAAGPNMKEIVPGGPKLLKFDLRTGQVVARYAYDAPIIEKTSYLNDVRIDTARQIAYLTDSGTGAIIVTDLRAGASRRLLADDPSTHSENIDVVIDGKPWRREGEKPSVHSDGIALSPDGQWLYYHALTGATLYRVPTVRLNDPSLPPDVLRRDVQNLGRTGPCDGMIYDRAGALFLTGLEDHAIERYLPTGAAGKRETLLSSPQLQWPDTFAIGPDGALYVTTSQIDKQPTPPGPYKLFKIVRQR